MNKLCFVLAVLGISFNSKAQTYLGGGNATGISVSASSSYQDTSWGVESAVPLNTVTGKGMLATYFDAARLLKQATLGFDETHVQDVLNMANYEAWIDDQFTKNSPSLLTTTENVVNIINDSIAAAMPGVPLDTLKKYYFPRRPSWKHFSYAWWNVITTNSDLLRHRVATALSEILVISRNSELSGYGDGLADYYDKLAQHSFGNYRDLLFDVTVHACMGFYLSHLNNPKTDTAIGQHPDENYAREIMQLFSIGLYELNNDGTRKQSGGQDIPTYDNVDIAEFAKVFTGLGVGDFLPQFAEGDTVNFGDGLWRANVTIPMRMWEVDDPSTSWRDEDQHEDGVKNLLNGFVVPDGQSGMQDINDAIDNLFNHANVGPFLAYRLIQRMVKSNPSPAYVGRVATAFNGAGPYGTVRGDMKAVIKAILLDDEARSASFQEDMVNSRLTEPLTRYTNMSRAIQLYDPNGFYWNVGYNFYEDTKQAVFGSPSVFNFFLYDDVPNGPINDLGLVAPEFKIHDSRTSIGYMNNAYRWTASWGEIMSTWECCIDNLTLMHNTEVEWLPDEAYLLARDTEAYINWLDKHLMVGNMSDETREVIRTALNGFEKGVSWHHYQQNRARMGLYLSLISPDYCIIR